MAPANRRDPVTPRMRRSSRPALAGLAAGIAIGAVLATGVLAPRAADAGRTPGATGTAVKTAKTVGARAAQANAAGTESNATAARPVAAKGGSAPVAKSAGSAGGKPVARMAQSGSGVLKVTAPSAPQEERVTYHYNALGRRDPFVPLVGGGFVGMDVGGAAPPDVGGIKVVGIVWGASDKFALVEDPRGNSLVLRRGDKVMNGVVETLKRDALVVKLDMEGISQSVTIPVTRKGEQNDGN